jgi:hypothetical protein
LYGYAGGRTAEENIGTKGRGRMRWMKKIRKEKLIRNCNGKREWQRLFGRGRPRCEDNIMVEIKELGLGCELESCGSGYGS